MNEFDEWMKHNNTQRPELNPETRISKLAQRIAEENRLDWTTLVGTGQDGLIIEKDVLTAVAKRKT
jgi:pyruvate/2-oxoglutarate dehydrogenase complex dihydrolipoamide acyltransferase (E2) component